MSHIENTGEGTAWTMHAARRFAEALRREGVLERTWRIRCELHRERDAHGRDPEVEGAVMRGLEGDDAQRPDLAAIAPPLRRIRGRQELQLMGTRRITFDRRHHFSYVACGGACALPGARLCLSAYAPGAALLLQRSYERPESDGVLTRARGSLRSDHADRPPALAGL
jgi:hypothetical protein